MIESRTKLTPMMERYLDVKRQHPDSLLLFRMGDFYELFFEDAQLAAKQLGLTLTSRDKGSPNPIPMAGFPYHALDGYLRKLIRSGHRVAICEQVEDPKKAKGLVQREVTQVVTPGTLTDESLLDPRESNYLACVYPDKGRLGLAWLDVSTGRFVTANLQSMHLVEEMARLQPAECLVPEAQEVIAELQSELPQQGTLFSERPPWCFAATPCRNRLLTHFNTTTVEGFDVEEDSPAITAAGALLEYVQETQKTALTHIVRLEPYRRGRNLIIDEATRSSLELTQTIRERTREGSLLEVIDETVSPMGARLLADWLSNPLTDRDHINLRLDAVEELVGDALLCHNLREQLEPMYDLQRLTARIATLRASPRDLACLARTLALLPELKAKLSARQALRIDELESKLDLCEDIRSDVEAALVDEPPLATSDGQIIRPGYHTILDEKRDLALGGKQWIAAYQSEQVERTGISNLKVGFNRVFGYYLEVTAAQADKVPDDYIRKQTLKNQERFITPELKQYEEQVLQAQEQANGLEQELFNSLRERVAEHTRRLQATAEVLAEIDVLAALAALATHNNYCRPEITNDPILDIREGRHPVLDRLRSAGEFVPNDVCLGETHGRIQIITGPNMAGKSTFIRQAALITIMAQMGSFVPASEARLGLADRVFARVGASDELGKGQSTFMVEMTETARILNAATVQSLVILDEIGRGTSTYDGISLAWAVTEYLHDTVRCRTLFATHYHELTDLTSTLGQAANWNVAVQEQDEDIAFLHRIIPGAANKSYGIHVARLAGVPSVVIQRARVVLETLESEHQDEDGRSRIPGRPSHPAARLQLTLFSAEPHPVLDDIRNLDVDQMTPLAALQELHRIREELQH